MGTDGEGNRGEESAKRSPGARKLGQAGGAVPGTPGYDRCIEAGKPYWWKPGQSGNPSGRPKGRISIAQRLKTTLAQDPALAQALVDAMIARSLSPNGTKDLSMLLDRVDGAVARTVHVEDTRHIKRLGFSDPLMGTAGAVIEAEARVRTLLGDGRDSAGDSEEDSDSAATLPVEVVEEDGVGSEEEEEVGQV